MSGGIDVRERGDSPHPPTGRVTPPPAKAYTSPVGVNPPHHSDRRVRSCAYVFIQVVTAYHPVAIASSELHSVDRRAIVLERCICPPGPKSASREARNSITGSTCRSWTSSTSCCKPLPSSQCRHRSSKMSHPQSIFKQSTFHGKSMLSIRRNTIAQTSIHTQLDQLRSTGRYDCFKLKWHPIYADKSMWPVPFHLFWDSDIAKWIEGACYFLQYDYDEKIDKAIQELVEMIRSAQGEDGYLNVHYTVVEPEKRWSNLQDMHEL